MTKDQLKEVKLPDSPGVYFFLGTKKQILYIGKANSLKNRVQSYFAANLNETRSDLIEKMVVEAKTVEYTVTDSVLEALILEANLIRTHKPRYNTRSKDDKSYNHLVITDEEWPRVLVIRGKDLTEQFASKKIKYDFGPFPSGALFKDALKIIRRLFKFYDTKIPIGSERSKMARGKIDFNRQIGLYPDPTKRKEYLRTIKHLKLFFEGKKHNIIKELEIEMMSLAKKEKFEEANLLKKKIYALKHIEDIALVKNDYRVYRDNNSIRVEAYDVAHHGGKDMVGVMTVVESGEAKPSEYRKFKIQSVSKANDPAALKEILERRFQHSEWPTPQILVVDGSTAQINVAEKTLKSFNLIIPIVAVVKNDKHKVDRLIAPTYILEKFKQDILLANAESHRFAISFHRRLARKSQLK
jgi:excinuclease ABC subunit C